MKLNKLTKRKKVLPLIKSLGGKRIDIYGKKYKKI